MRNVQLLTATMQYIVDHPDEHDQSTFINGCGTAACFAGHAALMSGWSARDIVRSHDMFTTGARLLGLTAREVATLFAPWNTIPILEAMVRDLVNGDELRPGTAYRREDALARVV